MVLNAGRPSIAAAVAAPCGFAFAATFLIVFFFAVTVLTKARFPVRSWSVRPKRRTPFLLRVGECNKGRPMRHKNLEEFCLPLGVVAPSPQSDEPLFLRHSTRSKARRSGFTGPMPESCPQCAVGRR